MKKAKKALSVSIVFLMLSAIIAMAAVYVKVHEKLEVVVLPSPNAPEQIVDTDGFPEVDWDYWQSINSDVIGWITVPGTEVDYPIVQARAEDPSYYLEHDVYMEQNYKGCPYLDVACADTGIFGSKNAVISAHNIGHGDTSMFAAFANYSDTSFASEHASVLIQTPEEKRVVPVHAVDVIEGGEPVKRTEFLDATDWKIWWAENMEISDVVLDTTTPSSGNAITCVTCSYSRFDDERTVVYAG